MLSSVVADYNDAIMDVDQDRALKVVQTAVNGGASPEAVIFELIVPAIEALTRETGNLPEANLSQNFLMARVASRVTEEMLKRMTAPPPVAGRVVLGAAAGDFHSLGKSIVGGCLRSQMFGVIDLGVNVPAQRFVDEAIRNSAQIIGVSAMMAHTALGEDGCLGVRRILKERGLEDRIKIVVGGAPFRYNPSLCEAAQADGWAPDGIAAGKVVGGLIDRMAR